MVSAITSLEFFITSKLLGLIFAQPINAPVVKRPPIHPSWFMGCPRSVPKRVKLAIVGGATIGIFGVPF
jgi:hypothetical protein